LQRTNADKCRHDRVSDARAQHDRWRRRDLSEADLGPVITLAREVARERFTSGYDLTEVQSAFSALETATWTRVLAELDPTQFAQTLGLVSTILGAGKDALGREYVSLAADAHTPSLDLRALFAGTAGV
jgi:hypothetical protein